MASVLRIQVFIVLCTVEDGVANTWLNILPWSWKSLEKHCICCIERRWHIPNKSPFTRLATVLLESNARIQLKIVKYWWWFWMQLCRDVASGVDRHLDIIFRLQVVEISSLVFVIFRAFNHPFSFTCKCFFALAITIIIIIFIIINFLQTGFLRVYWTECYITYNTRYHSSRDFCFLSMVLAVLCENEVLGWLISW